MVLNPNYLFIIILIFPFISPSYLLRLGADVSAVTGCPNQGLYHFLQTAYFHTFSDLLFNIIILHYTTWTTETIINETTNKILVHILTSSFPFMQYKRYLHFGSERFCMNCAEFLLSLCVINTDNYLFILIL